MINTTKQRLKAVSIIALLPALPLAARLFYMQTFRHTELAGKAESTTSAPTAEIRLRGTIYDRQGNILAESLPTYTCSISKRDVNSQAAVIAVLSKELAIPEPKIREKWNKARNFFYLKKEIDPTVYENLSKKLQEKKLTGVILARVYTRFHPNGELAKDFLGTVSYDHSGLSGLELMYDETLRGTIARHQTYKDRHGQIIYNPDLKTEVDLKNITLTLDSRIQYYAEKALDGTVEKTHAKGGFAIVQDPNTGEILAAASNPRHGGQSLPFQMTYEPGSTFKGISVASALEDKVIQPKDTIDCHASGKWEIIPGIVIGDDHKTGVLDIGGILAQSSNICAAKIALKLGKKAFYSHIRAFGFGTKTTLNFPGESKGIIRPFETWKDLDLAVAAYGHGLSSTGIQLITAYSAIANGGTLMEPIIIKEVTDSYGKVLSSEKPREIRRVLSPETIAKIEPMLERVITEGTGWRAKLRGYSIAGKTGTSKKLVDGRYSSSKYISSFAGFLPAKKPRFTILAAIDEPGGGLSGGEAAAPIFAEIAQGLLADNTIEPDLPEELNSKDYLVTNPQDALRNKYPPAHKTLAAAEEKQAAENHITTVLQKIPVTTPLEKIPEEDENAIADQYDPEDGVSRPGPGKASRNAKRGRAAQGH